MLRRKPRKKRKMIGRRSMGKFTGLFEILKIEIC